PAHALHGGKRVRNGSVLVGSRAGIAHRQDAPLGGLALGSLRRTKQRRQQEHGSRSNLHHLEYTAVDTDVRLGNRAATVTALPEATFRIIMNSLANGIAPWRSRLSNECAYRAATRGSGPRRGKA